MKVALVVFISFVLLIIFAIVPNGLSLERDNSNACITCHGEHTQVTLRTKRPDGCRQWITITTKEGQKRKCVDPERRKTSKKPKRRSNVLGFLFTNLDNDQ